MKYQCKHPEFFKDWARPDLERENGNIVLYGAGKCGSVAAHCLEKKGIDFVCFCDTDEKKQHQEFCGHPVISPQELAEKYKDHTILISTIYYYVILEQLRQAGFEKVYSCVSLFENFDFEGYTMYEPEYQARTIDQYFFALGPSGRGCVSYIPQVQIPVTLRCTLRCRECSTYTPYCKQPAEDFDYNGIVQAMEKLMLGYDSVGNILLYGGEPLLYKDLYRLVDVFAQNPKIEKVTVVTNGTLLPDKRLLESFGRPKVLVRVSDYGPLSSKKDELISLLRDNEINLEVTEYNVRVKWTKTPTVDLLNETEEELREKVKHCCVTSKFLTLIRGKAFQCGFAAYMHYHKAVPDFSEDYVDLLNFTGTDFEMKKRIDALLQAAEEAVPMNLCKYCTFRKFEDDLPVAEQTTEHLQFKKVY